MAQMALAAGIVGIVCYATLYKGQTVSAPPRRRTTRTARRAPSPPSLPPAQTFNVPDVLTPPSINWCTGAVRDAVGCVPTGSLTTTPSPSPRVRVLRG